MKGKRAAKRSKPSKRKVIKVKVPKELKELNIEALPIPEPAKAALGLFQEEHVVEVVVEPKPVPESTDEGSVSQELSPLETEGPKPNSGWIDRFVHWFAGQQEN